jgi:hypothetical protein
MGRYAEGNSVGLSFLDRKTRRDFPLLGELPKLQALVKELPEPVPDDAKD